ncbi:phage portal protein [Mammaliicoccus sp. A-M4]|uniref:phage portal protein n=1 Tax=Mammaliicoccus sp. A-M4 TaxID=2898664 RepID=UPI001EFA5B6B|nr:phage portal protein [Mammaliicoccus sp. A-M4]
MGIFFKGETRNINPVETQSTGDVFSAFPTHTIPLTALNWDEHKALRNSDIFTAITTIAKDIAKLDIRVKENGIYRDKDRIEYLLNQAPNKYYNAYQLKNIVMMSALLTGKGYIKIERNPNNQVQALYHVKTSQIKLKDDKKGYYYEVTNNGKTLRVKFEDVICIMPFSTDGINPITALSALHDDMNTQKFSKKFFSNFFANGSQAGSVLKMRDGKLSPEARKKIKDEWQQANSGEDQAGKVLVLDETMDFQQLEINTDILNVINNNTASTKAIAKAFGLPLAKLGLNDPNVSLQSSLDDYLLNTLGSYMKVITAELNFKLVNAKDQYNKEFVFDTQIYRTVNWKEHVELINTQLDKGGITLDEYRKQLGYEPIPDGLGANHRVDLNHINLNVADDYQLRKTSVNNQAPQVNNSEGGENY